jgi:hypothetical protein
MIGNLIYVILLIIVLGVLIWAIQQLVPLLPMDARFHRIVQVLLTVVVVLVIVYAIAALFGIAPPLGFRG